MKPDGILLLLDRRCWPNTGLIVKGPQHTLRLPAEGYEQHPQGIKQVLVIEDAAYDGSPAARGDYTAAWATYVGVWKKSPRAQS